MIARVFGRSGAFEDLSVLLDSVEWMVKGGASVINMSLGGVGYSIAADRAYKRWQMSNNVLFVVAAGNDGEAGISTTMYPAAYDGVSRKLVFKCVYFMEIAKSFRLLTN